MGSHDIKVIERSSVIQNNQDNNLKIPERSSVDQNNQDNDILINSISKRRSAVSTPEKSLPSRPVLRRSFSEAQADHLTKEIPLAAFEGVDFNLSKKKESIKC